MNDTTLCCDTTYNVIKSICIIYREHQEIYEVKWKFVLDP